MFTFFAPVLSLMAHVLIAFSVTFLVPGIWAWCEDHQDLQLIWLAGFGLTALSGLALGAITQRHRRELKTKDGFLLVNMVWLVLPAYSALPLMFLVPEITWFKAYFEAMSALTATGATALTGLDHLPVSVNIWRCFLQLIGGLGIMLLVVAVLPMLGLGGMHLYKTETPGPMKDTKFTPRIAETARGLWGVYFLFSGVCLLAYRWAGMSWADAFMHMCTTMGLGGFSSYDASFGHFNSPMIEWVAIVFMILAGISFVRYFVVLRSRSIAPISAVIATVNNIGPGPGSGWTLGQLRRPEPLPAGCFEFCHVAGPAGAAVSAGFVQLTLLAQIKAVFLPVEQGETHADNQKISNPRRRGL